MRSMEFPWLKGKRSFLFGCFFLSWKQSSSNLFVEVGELSLVIIIFLYTTADSFVVGSAVGTAAWPELGYRSVLEAELRRVGLDEDGPENLHVLAWARLDVLVQDVDPPPCLITRKTKI
jgi:hypothetical protein